MARGCSSRTKSLRAQRWLSLLQCDENEATDAPHSPAMLAPAVKLLSHVASPRWRSAAHAPSPMTPSRRFCAHVRLHCPA